MDKMNRMKEEYNEIKAPESLRMKTAGMFAARARRRTVIQRTLSTAAMFVLIFAMTVNIMPNTAKAIMDVPVLSGIVKVFTLGRYTAEENGGAIDVTTPQLVGMLDENVQKELNEKLKDNANAIIESYEKEMAQLGEEAHKGVYAGYEVVTDNENILAVDIYTEVVMGSAATSHDFYTIDKKSGTLVTFNSMFSGDVSVIDEYIRAEMERRNNEENGTFEIGEDGFVTIGDAPEFYVNEKGNIVICFDEYEVAAGCEGAPQFEIPQEILK